MAKLFRAAIMGPPGSGKGTISKRIAQSFGLQYLSSGHFLREGIAAKTEAGLLVKTYVDRGMLVPDHVMTRLMLPRLKQLSSHSWLLDGGLIPTRDEPDEGGVVCKLQTFDRLATKGAGFPRTLGQALALNSLYQLDLVISLNIPYETLKERLSDRWIHPASGRVYNMGFNPPRLQGKDDITGEPLIQHDDDKPEALMARLRQYKEVAKPVIDLYKSQGILHSFSGTETDRIWPYINSLLSTKMDTQPSDACQPQTP